MRTLTLILVGALAFIVLAGVIEIREARRIRRRLLERKRGPIVLHPLTQHPPRRVPGSLSRRVLHYAGLFVGFLLAVYALMVLLKGVLGNLRE